MDKPEKREEVAKLAIEAAICAGVESPKEAAEVLVGREMTDEEWSEVRAIWERNWPRWTLAVRRVLQRFF
jgi:hypothetical protein